MDMIYNNRIVRWIYLHRAWILSFAVLAALVWIIPWPAMGNVFDDAVQGMKDYADSQLASAILGEMGDFSVIPQSFDNLINTNSSNTSSLYTVLHDSFLPQILQYIAAPILTLVMLMQLYKISMKVEGHATLPAVKEVFMLFFTFTLIFMMVRHAWDICEFAFDLFASIPEKAAASFPQKVLADKSIGYDWTDVGFGGVLVTYLGSIGMSLATLIAQAVSFIVIVGRGLEMYFYATLSPLPVALLGFDETKQMGIGFLKNFAALALSYLFVYFILSLWHIVWMDVVFAGPLNVLKAGEAITVLAAGAKGAAAAAGAAAAGATAAGAAAAGASAAATITLGAVLLRVVAMTVILITALTSTDRMARAVLGG